jgi:LEA14-like dessication related protein
MKILFPILVLAFGVTSCKDVKQPEFQEVKKFTVENLSFDEASLSADLLFNNPNSFGFQIRKIECEVYLDSALLGNFRNSEMITIPSSGTFILPINGQAKTAVLMGQQLKIIAGKESIMQVKGTARVGRSGLFKNVPINFSDTLLLPTPGMR